MHPEALTKKGTKLFQKLGKFDNFYLAGGTALALQVGHRISEDFDLFTEDYLEKTLLDDVEEAYSDLEVYPSVNHSEELTVFVSGVKITFLRYPFPLLIEPEEYKGVSLMVPKEIGATKAYTMGRRGEFKDYVDLFFLLRKGLTELNEIIGLASEKYGDKFNDRLFLEQLVYLKDIETTEIRFLGGEAGIEEIENFFRKAVEGMDF